MLWVFGQIQRSALFKEFSDQAAQLSAGNELFNVTY
jgi:hypothetical protein